MALVIEVSDNTLAHDRDVRLPRYTQAGVPEVWIVGAHSEPSSGRYRTSREFGPGEQARSATLENLSLPLDKILG